MYYMGMDESTVPLYEVGVTSPDFKQKIDSITSRELTPENIDSYAEGALDDLISVVSDITAAYDGQFTASTLTGRDHERAALIHYGLDADYIETTLDYISEKADQIRGLDAVIHDITVHSDKVVTPPDYQNVSIVANDGSFNGDKQHIPRLKTVLFLLENTFDTDLEDAEQCTVTDGVLADGMMRGESYYLIDLPNLNRDVLVCDEEGNATFVLDRAKFAESGISVEALAHLTKDELTTFLDEHPGAGHRLIYSPQFVDYVVGLLEKIPEGNSQGDESKAGAARVLKVEADGSKVMIDNQLVDISDYVDQSHLAEELGVSRALISKIQAGARDELGSILKVGYKLQYSPTQQAMLRNLLAERLAKPIDYSPGVPEEYQSRVQLSKAWGIHSSSFDKAVETLGDELGKVSQGRRSNNLTNIYSPQQQTMIRGWLENNHYLVGKPPEDYLSIKGMSTQLDLGGKSMVSRAIKALGAELGEPESYKSYARITPYYSPAQQEQIRQWIVNNSHNGKLARTVRVAERLINGG